MSSPFFYFPTVEYNWNQWKYTDKEVALIVNSLWKICNVVREQMSPLVNIDTAFKDLRIQFVTEKTPELRKYNALGIAYKDRNTTVIPTGCSRFELTARTAIVAMEATHSLINRLTGDQKMCNDLIHWLYNEGHTKIYEHRTLGIIKDFGSALRVIVPDMRYGWEHREEIMDDIRAGKYKEGTHKYWSDPTWSDDVSVVLATEHELHHIREILM